MAERSAFDKWAGDWFGFQPLVDAIMPGDEKAKARAAAAKPAPPPLDFSSGPARTRSAAAPKGFGDFLPTKWGGQTDVLPEVQSAISAAGLPTVITSAERSADEQRQLIRQWEANGRRGARPANNSQHLVREALDLRIPEGTDPGAFALSVRKALPVGFTVLNEGDHVHVAKARTGASPVERAMSVLGDVPGPVGYTPALMNPGAVMSMLTPPTRPGRINIPDLPKRAALPDAPALEQTDVDARIAALSKYAPKAYDADEGGRGRFQEILGAMALAAHQADPRQGIGKMLAGIGGAAVGAQKERRQLERQLRAQAEEAMRDFGLKIEGVRGGLEDKNLETRNRNTGNTWEIKVKNIERADEDAFKEWGANKEEVLINAQLDEGYANRFNDFLNTRAKLGIGVLENNTQSVNQARQYGAQTANSFNNDLRGAAMQFAQNDEARAARREEQATADPMEAALRELAPYGISEVTLKTDPDAAQTALAVSQAVKAGNSPAALRAFAKEVVRSGRMNSWAASKGLKKPEEVEAALTTFIADPASGAGVAGIIDELAAQGYPAARILKDARK